MNSEPELSAEARRLIAAAKGYDDPSTEDRARVKSRWLASIAAAASVSALGEAARAASTSTWGAKAVAWVVALAAGAAGIYALLDDPRQEGSTELEARTGSGAVPEPAAPPRVAALPVVAPAPAAAPVAPAPAPSVPEDPEPEAEAKVPPGSAVAPVAKPTPPRAPVPARPAPAPVPVDSVEAAEVPASAQPEGEASALEAAVDPELPAPEPVLAPTTEASRQLGEETLLLSKVRRSLREGAAARALEELAQYRRRFEKPLLGMEAAALRVDALCRSGNVAAGRAEAESFQATWPASPLEQRVRAACQ